MVGGGSVSSYHHVAFPHNDYHRRRPGGARNSWQSASGFGGDYPWSAKLLRREPSSTTRGGIGEHCSHLPVTVDAPAQFNLPEYFQAPARQNDGHSIDRKQIPAARFGQPRRHVSFAQEWMDDRSHEAVVYLLKSKSQTCCSCTGRPRFRGTRQRAVLAESNAILEYTDELIGQADDRDTVNYAIALVSDHGFESRQRRECQRPCRCQGVGGIRSMGGTCWPAPAASSFCGDRQGSKYGVDDRPARRDCPFRAAVCERRLRVRPASGFMFAGSSAEAIFSKPAKRNHNHWPMRYRSVYVLWAPINAAAAGLAEGYRLRFASVLKRRLVPAQGNG